MRSFSDVNVGRASVRAVGIITAVLTLGAAGCDNENPLASAKLYPVTGKVLLPDGKPLTSGHVVFVSTKSTVTSTATIESDGSFAFKGSPNGGLPEGEYKIKIEAGSTAGGKASSDKSKPTLPFANQFLDEDSSGLTRTVSSDETKNDFELKLVPTKSENGGDERRAAR